MIRTFEELKVAVKLFDTSLKGFQGGAPLPGGDGKPVFLKAAEGDKALGILKKAQDIWTPYQQKLLPVLATLVSPKALTDARDYVELLFSTHVKEQLVQGINPLAEAELTVRNRLGQDTQCYLSFHFNRVHEGGTVRATLNERKVVERAKGLLMAHRHLTEAEAYKVLRQMAMNQNRRLLEVAEAVLTAADVLPGRTR